MIFPRLLTALAFAAMPSAALASFTDVSSDHPNASAIEYMQAKGVVGGYADGTYRPDASINRAEFVKIMMLTYFNDGRIDLCDPNHIYDFSDASKTSWYAKTLCFAVQHQMVEGYADGTFRPDAPVNAAEAAKIIASIDNLDIGGYPKQDLVRTPDLPWYTVYVRYLKQRNAFPKSILTYDQLLTRGEMAEIVYDLRSENQAQNRDYQRSSDINAILNALYQYAIDHDGILPFIPQDTATQICAVSVCGTPLLDLQVLVGTYLARIPRDPSFAGEGSQYFIMHDANWRITVSAPHAELRVLSVTR